MKLHTSLTLLCLLCGLAASTRADITIRISAKAVLNPVTGLRQPGVTEATFSNTVAVMNAMLDSSGRGYRFRWDGTLINVGGLGQDNSGPSRYYSVDFINDPNGGTLKNQFEANAIANPATYGWDSTAVNIYIVEFGGANWNICSFPGSHIILVNGVAGYSTPIVLHEIGHYFNLSHTFNGSTDLNSNGSPCADGCSCAQHIGGGNDAVADTILDNACWANQDDIAQGNYGANYASLPASRQAAVDRIWNNLMSYHDHQHAVSLFTSDQMDRLTDAANGSRNNVVTGRSWFVDRNGGCLFHDGSPNCHAFGGPFAVVRDGVNSAQSGDIVLIRAGNYNEPMTINRTLTLRASRGNVSIGIP